MQMLKYSVSATGLEHDTYTEGTYASIVRVATIATNQLPTQQHPAATNYLSAAISIVCGRVAGDDSLDITRASEQMQICI